MRKSNDTPSPEPLAAMQWGMFTTAQARDLGTRQDRIARLEVSSRVETARYGIYRFVTGAGR